VHFEKASPSGGHLRRGRGERYIQPNKVKKRREKRKHQDHSGAKKGGDNLLINQCRAKENYPERDIFHEQTYQKRRRGERCFDASISYQ